jgi:dihydroorotase
MPERFDCIIKGGTVVDPGADILGPLDVAIADGRIARVQPEIPADQATTTIDATDLFVTPGLIDLHTHVYHGGSFWGIDPEPIAARSGVTTWVDAGSSGVFTVESFRRGVVNDSPVRIVAYVNISAIGLVAEEYELSILEHCDVELCRRAVEAHRDIVVGVKARMSSPTVGGNGLEPLRRALRAADETNMPLMVHIGAGPPDVADILEAMRPGDILTHCFTGQTMRLIDENDRLLESARRARDAGVIFDLGHGAGSFSFHSAESLFEAEFRPDVISTDIHQLSQYGHGLVDGGTGLRSSVRLSQATDGDLPTCMTKALYLGMSLPDVVRATTSTPAKLIGRDAELGTLRSGAVADIALFAMQDGDFELYDVHGDTRQASKRLKCVQTIVAGTPLQQRDDPPPPPWIELLDRSADAVNVR